MKKTKLVFVTITFVILILFWINSNDWVRVVVADYYIKSGQRGKAVDIYSKIYRKEEILSENKTVRRLLKLKTQKEYDVVLFLADYYGENGDLTKEIECLKRLLQLKPAGENDSRRLYDIYIGRNDIQNAADLITDYEKSNDKVFPIKTPDNLLWKYKLGINYLDKGMLERAEESFKVCLEKDDNFADVHYLLGAIYQRQGKTEGAVKQYQQAISIAPNHMDALIALEGCYKKSGGDEDRFIRQKIIELTPQNKVDVNFSNKIQLIGYDVKMGTDRKAVFKFWFKCLDKIDGDYSCVVNIEPENPSLLPSKRKNIGFLCFSDNIEENTSSWQIGEVHQHEFVRKVNPGNYQLKLFLKSYGDKKFSAEVLKNIAANSKTANLGVIGIY